MIIETKEIYKCGYCKKLYQIKKACINHEVSCGGNPANERACFYCPNLEKKSTETYGQYYDGTEYKRDIDLLYCKAKDIFLYPPKVEIKGNAIELCDHSNEPMPVKCEMQGIQIEF